MLRGTAGEMSHADDALVHHPESRSLNLQMRIEKEEEENEREREEELTSRKIVEHKLEPCDFLFKNLFPTAVKMTVHLQGSPCLLRGKISHSVYEMLHNKLYFHLRFSFIIKP